jgi:uncharacterized protein (DUF1697 family)
VAAGSLVVLLRGVNVGGHRTFRPAALVRELGHLGAVNIGAAGTFVIRERVSQATLRSELAARLPFETEIMICPGRDVTRLMALEPFARHAARPDIVPFVSLLARAPKTLPPMPLNFPATVIGREQRFVFGLYRREMKAVGYLGTLDRAFGVPVTTRNWNTISAIARVVAGG